MIDLQAHHERCGHVDGSLTDVAGRAMTRGLTVLGVCGHAPRFAEPVDHPRPYNQMACSQWDREHVP